MRTNLVVDSRVSSANSDLDGVALASEALRRSRYTPLRDVACEGIADTIYLRGCVPTFFLKQMAQVLVAHATEARRISNRIEVRDPDVDLQALTAEPAPC